MLQTYNLCARAWFNMAATTTQKRIRKAGFSEALARMVRVDAKAILLPLYYMY